MTTKVKERKVALQKLFDCLLSPSMAPLLVIEYSIKNREEKFFAFFSFGISFSREFKKYAEQKPEMRHARVTFTVACVSRYVRRCSFALSMKRNKNKKTTKMGLAYDDKYVTTSTINISTRIWYKKQNSVEK